MITSHIAALIDQSVLCWLATISADGFPNVSPKEAFLHDGQGKILVANIASPLSVQNIEQNDKVCISFVNIFTQKGYKVTGRATIFKSSEAGFNERHGKLVSAIGSVYPIISVIEIDPVAIDAIIAPSYRLFPESGPLDRIKDSLRTYQVDEYKRRAEHGSTGSVD